MTPQKSIINNENKCESNTKCNDFVKLYGINLLPNTPNFMNFLNKKGIKISKKIGNGLQGNIYLGKFKGIYVAIKMANIKLCNKGISMINGNKSIRVHENILKEYKIMSYLNDIKNKPLGFVNIYGLLYDKWNYYLVMQYCGISMFDYISNNHKRHNKNNILSNNFEINWKIHIRKLFKQIGIFISFLHKNNCCHLDISLENLLISNNIVYFCDYGLAEIFPFNNFNTNKYCGKSNYEAPEVYKKRGYFNGKKADIWCLGVVLFMMLTGVPLYKKASLSDAYFYNLINGFLKIMVKQWDLQSYMDNNTYDLLNNIFKPENDRYNINQILKHIYCLNIETYN